MKIVHLTQHYRPHVGGVERHVERVARLLSERGHAVTVMAGDHAGDLPETEHDGALTIERFPATRSLWRMKAWFVRRLPALWRADAVHVHTAAFFTMLPRAVWPRGKTVYTAHGWGGRYPIPPESVRRTRRVVRRASKLVCIGDFIGKWYGVDPDMVSYGAVEPPALHRVEREADRVCMVGRLAEDTGAAMFARGLRQAADRGRRIAVTVCGDGVLADEVRDRLTHERIELDWRGFVTDPERSMAAAAVTLTSGYLGILEALAMGSAVVAAADNPVKEDYLGLSPMASFIGIARSPAEVADRVEAALDNPDPQRRREGEAFARSQTWGRLVDGYERLYREVSSRTNGSSSP